MEDLAASSALDLEVQITDDDIPGRKKATVRMPSLPDLASGLVSLVTLPWEIVTGAIEDDGSPLRIPDPLDDESGDAEEAIEENDDAVLSFDDLVNATGIAPRVKDKPVELVIVRSLKRGAGSDTFGDAPLAAAASAIGGAVASLTPTVSLFSRRREWYEDESDVDTLLADTDTLGDTTTPAEEAAGAPVVGSAEDDEDLDVDGAGSGATMLVQVNAGLGMAQPGGSDGLDLMLVPLLVMGRWTMASNCQRLAGSDYPILIPNARRSGGRHDASLQSVIIPDTGNPMMPSGLVSSSVGFKVRGPDFTLEYKGDLDTRQPDQHTLQYFQTVLPAVALGAEVAAAGGPFLSALPTDVRLAGMLAYTADDGTSTWLAKVDQTTPGGAVVWLRHFREVNERAKLTVDLSVMDNWTSEVVGAVELPLRQEPFMRDPYTLLKASVSTNGTLAATLEHSLAAGTECFGRLELGASVNLLDDSNKVSVGYMLQA